MIIFHGSTEIFSSLLFSGFICYVIILGKSTTQARMLSFSWTAPYKSEKVNVLNLGTGGRRSVKQIGYIQIIPNGTLILRSRSQNSTNPQNLLRHKSVLGNVILNLKQATSNNKWDIKIYGEGTEHKLPPFLERIIQRIQTYFSVYKHTDTSALGSPTISVDNRIADNVRAKVNFTSLDTTLLENGNSNLTQPLNTLEGESTVQENHAELIEFIAIGEYDDDYKVMAED